jgi:hypothetical protein
MQFLLQAYERLSRGEKFAVWLGAALILVVLFVMQASVRISSILAMLAILVSVGSFAYTNIRRGKLQFWEPESYRIDRPRDDTGALVNIRLLCPVNVTNTGSVVHTVNSIRGILKEAGGVTHDFRMQLEVDDVLEPTQTMLATGFAVPPNSNAVKRFAFACDDPTLQLAPGEYSFALYPWIDGTASTTPSVSFKFELTAEKASDINAGRGPLVDSSHYELDRSLLQGQ